MKTMAVQVLTRAAPARPPVGDGGLMTAVSDVSVSSSAVAAVGRVLRSKEGAGEPAPAGAAEGTSPRSLWRFGVCADADTVSRLVFVCRTLWESRWSAHATAATRSFKVTCSSAPGGNPRPGRGKEVCGDVGASKRR